MLVCNSSDKTALAEVRHDNAKIFADHVLQHFICGGDVCDELIALYAPGAGITRGGVFLIKLHGESVIDVQRANRADIDAAARLPLADKFCIQRLAATRRDNK